MTKNTIGTRIVPVIIAVAIVLLASSLTSASAVFHEESKQRWLKLDENHRQMFGDISLGLLRIGYINDFRNGDEMAWMIFDDLKRLGVEPNQVTDELVYLSFISLGGNISETVADNHKFVSVFLLTVLQEVI